MRNFIFILSVLLLVEGVSGDEKVKVTVSGMKGDSVTLKPDDAEIQTGDLILWKFNDTIIVHMKKTTEVSTSDAVVAEKFKGRVQLDQTGSLTITNTRTTDSGLYQLQIRKSTGVISKEYKVTVNDVFVVDTDGVKSVSVMEGDSVTLHTGVTDKLRDDKKFQWTFKDEVIHTDGLNDWRNIDLNDQTGELAIRNIRNNQFGVYKVKINTSSIILHRKFHINNIDEVKTVTVKEGDPFVLRTGVFDIQEYDQISWKFRNGLIGEFKKGDNRFSLFSADGQLEDRLQLNEKTGSLTISYFKNTDSGDYHLEMNSNSHTIQRSISVTVKSSDRSGAVSGISGASVGLMVWAVTVLLLQEV